MTGKEFKAYAALVHDEAEVQVNTQPDSYRATWIPLSMAQIQAVLRPKTSPTTEPTALA